MRRAFSIWIVLLPNFLPAQSLNPDSLYNSLSTATHDSARYNTYFILNEHYRELNRDSSVYYADKRLDIARKNNLAYYIANSLGSKADALLTMGDYYEALQLYLEAFTIAETISEQEIPWSIPPGISAIELEDNALGFLHLTFANLMNQTGNREQEKHHIRQLLKHAGQLSDEYMRNMLTSGAFGSLGYSYLEDNKLDSAFYYSQLSLDLDAKIGFKKYMGFSYLVQGLVMARKNREDSAIHYYRMGLASAREEKNRATIAVLNFEFANSFLRKQNRDSSLHYAKNARQEISDLGPGLHHDYNLGIAYENLHKAYELAGQRDSSYKYQRLALVTKDSLYKTKINGLSKFQSLTYAEQLRLQNLESENEAFQSRIRVYILVGLALAFSVIAFILYRNNRQKNRSNTVLKNTLTELQATQSQLIHAEKMASLGELTAGIAHEIQNPLNFVNNFSEVSTELISELVDEVDRGKTKEAKIIAADLKQNLEKINHHGKRADTIIKGMLQHSRANSGVKEPTDINALCDEYLRLAYHGLRAKDNSFNAKLETGFDSSIGKINIVPQDIGRVILNLITNAFYAVDEKKKQAPAGYEPAVTVSTKKTGRQIEIRVADNGTGIPQKVIDKIFQPFFTTKPTGQGTGLGLSLSYDIIKAHGGELRVETKEGEGTQFIIQLPNQPA